MREVSIKQAMITVGRRTDDGLVGGRLDVVGKGEPVVPPADACSDEREHEDEDEREHERVGTVLFANTSQHGR